MFQGGLNPGHLHDALRLVETDYPGIGRFVSEVVDDTPLHEFQSVLRGNTVTANLRGLADAQGLARRGVNVGDSKGSWSCTRRSRPSHMDGRSCHSQLWAPGVSVVELIGRAPLRQARPRLVRAVKVRRFPFPS